MTHGFTMTGNRSPIGRFSRRLLLLLGLGLTACTPVQTSRTDLTQAFDSILNWRLPPPRHGESVSQPIQVASLEADASVQLAQVFGSYSAGCIHHPARLPQEGEGYKVLRTSRERYYGHPSLIRFVQSFSSEIKMSGLGTLLVADMAQNGGGPMPSGHHSHQTGLDADFWFGRLNELEERQFSAGFRENPTPVVMVNNSGSALTEEWNSSHAWVLKSAALRPEVERIFVHPRIKADLCERMGGQAWLAKVRPWRGHDYHFHVRLKCPPDSPHCRPQTPVNGEDGCGAELAQWLAGGAWKVAETSTRHAAPVNYDALPWQCRPTEVATAPFPRRR